MNIEEFPEESDSSDEDYVPGAKPEDQVSEVESDGDPEEPLSDAEHDAKTNSRRGKKRRKRGDRAKKKSKSIEDDENGEKCEENENKDESEEDKKKRADSLWESFMKDTGFKSKNTKCLLHVQNNAKASTETKDENAKQTQTNKVEEKVKITKVFQFAGEEVKVEKEVPVNSAEARLAQKSSVSDTQKLVKNRTPKGLGGIGTVLSQLGKKPKISTLEKSKLDWDMFKKEEKIEEELAAYNKGKDGYLERQDFLQRADLRRFEIEKEIRTIERNKRLDNVL